MKEKRLSDYTNLYQLATRQIVLLDRLNPRKLWNAIGILYEYLSGKTVLKYRPVVLRMDPTSHCNLRCPTCHPNGNTFGGPMSDTVFQRILERAPFEHLLKGTLYLFGEPFFNRRLPEMIRAVGAKQVPTSLSTNFNLFSEKRAHEIIDAGLSWIIICVDGADQESYAKYRVGGSLERVLENIELLVETKKKRKTTWPIIEVQCIEFPHNEHQIDRVRAMCRRLGVERFTVKRDALSQMNIDFTRVKTDVARVGSEGPVTAPANPDRPSDFPVLKPRAPRSAAKKGAKCVYLYGTLHIDYDGSVLPCCVGRSVFGNLMENTFDEIWNNEKFVAARAFFASGFRDKKPHLDLPCYTCPLFFPEQGEEHERVQKVRYE